MNLISVKDQEIEGKKVLLRVDLDVDLVEESRVDVTINILKYLSERGAAQISLIAHRGRPEGKEVEEMKLEPIINKIRSECNVNFDFRENLRFDPREEKGDDEFAQELVAGYDLFVNEAFASSHREHTSIVNILKFIKSCFGLRFVEEIENLSRVFENPQKPVVMLVSGVKDDKLTYIEDFIKIADKVLIGGRLPEYIHDNSALRDEEKVVVANLIADKEDISMHSMEAFEAEIEKAGTIVVSGPMGKFEDSGHRQGTERVFRAVANSSAFKLAGGGDSLGAIEMFGIAEKFDWLSVGGGAMLTFLAKGTLPGIEAIKS
jgi:phosphoglycerate kinase